ncbi:hypothetical protein GOV12_06870 [Candidatus Pacearchaeota archaeon]|nr:hypothetical protein [Candidatus Pacearchaeota archaeon]
MESEKKHKNIKDEICADIDELRVEYEKFKSKYDLPDFTELNKTFDIEEVDIHTQFLLRKIRRLISDRIASYMRFIEIILNPSNAPMFFYKLIKKLDSGDREKLSGIYEKLGNYELEIVSLDLNYSEEKEALFIIKAYNIFNEEVRGKLQGIIDKLGNGDDNSKKEINGSYFG